MAVWRQDKAPRLKNLKSAGFMFVICELGEERLCSFRDCEHDYARVIAGSDWCFNAVNRHGYAVAFGSVDGGAHNAAFRIQLRVVNYYSG